MSYFINMITIFSENDMHYIRRIWDKEEAHDKSYYTTHAAWLSNLALGIEYCVILSKGYPAKELRDPVTLAYLPVLLFFLNYGQSFFLISIMIIIK